jgi:eukaryotic-like serine/threonine-protein kinase
MAAQLEVIAGPDRGLVIPLPEGGPVLLGRGRQTASRLSDPHVSRAHCSVERRAGRLVLVDLRSVGGTFVNDSAVREHALRPGDVIRIGETKLRLLEDDLADQPTVPPERPARAARPKAPPPAGAEELVALPRGRLGELAGTVLAHFRVGSVVGRGDKGVVFRAVDLDDNTQVALKVLRPEFAQDEPSVKRFVRAMKTMLPLEHPNLVKVYGAGKKGPYCWVSMEYVEGESLTGVLRRLGVGGMLDWRHAFRVAVHLARALEYAHERHIIHRNLTPQNVLVRAGDKLTKLGDLMLAKALEGNLAREITQPGEVLGDVRFLSPEQTRTAEDVDARSDLYNLGALVYALLTGRPPFEGSCLAETIQMIRQAKPQPPKAFQMAVPEAFQGLVLQLLAKRPEARYQSATQVLTDLARVAKFHGVGL